MHEQLLHGTVASGGVSKATSNVGSTATSGKKRCCTVSKDVRKRRARLHPLLLEGLADWTSLQHLGPVCETTGRSGSLRGAQRNSGGVLQLPRLAPPPPGRPSPRPTSQERSLHPLQFGAHLSGLTQAAHGLYVIAHIPNQPPTAAHAHRRARTACGTRRPTAAGWRGSRPAPDGACPPAAGPAGLRRAGCCRVCLCVCGGGVVVVGGCVGGRVGSDVRMHRPQVGRTDPHELLSCVEAAGCPYIAQHRLGLHSSTSAVPAQPTPTGPAQPDASMQRAVRTDHDRAQAPNQSWPHRPPRPASWPLTPRPQHTAGGAHRS